MKDLTSIWINDEELDRREDLTDEIEFTEKVIINLKWCKGCAICVDFCPKNSLGMGRDAKAHVIDHDSCNSCGLCYLRCPDFAIKVPGYKG